MPHPYQQRAVRDLAWACFAPPLFASGALAGPAEGLHNCGLPLTAARRDWLAALDARPDPLLEHLAASPQQRLGLYFERLWQFFLAQDPDVELLAHNLPVREGGRTLGEFDCLYYCRRRQRHCHLELAVKYYLGYGTAAGGASPWSAWLGPNSQDRLDLKLDRLLQHQVRLADQPRGAEVLREHGIEDPLRELEVKGYLFRHPGQALPPPRGLDPARSLGHWWRLEELPGALLPRRRYQVLPRLQWLSPVHARPGEGMTADELFSALQAHFGARRQPALIAELDLTGAEQARFFVTDAGWPG
jgi:uncharacterized protein